MTLEPREIIFMGALVALLLMLPALNGCQSSEDRYWGQVSVATGQVINHKGK